MDEASISDILTELEGSAEDGTPVGASDAEGDAQPRTRRSSSSSKTGHGRRRRRSKRSSRQRLLRNWLIVLGVLVLMLGTAYALLMVAFNGIDRISIEQDPTLKRPAVVKVAAGEREPINILLLGSDSREPADTDDAGEQQRGFRTDAILVAQLSPDREHLTIMSIMRDNWVEVQGVGEAKINAAAAHGGLALTVNTVENFIDARIDHVALIGFDAFEGLTNAVGGVTVHNDIAYTAQNGGGDFTFKEGEITLNGEQALSFVRERYAFSDGDYQRVRNQQKYLKALMGELMSGETLGNAGKITGTFQAIRPYLTLSDSLNLQSAVSLGFDSRGLRQGGIKMFTSPTLGTATSADGQSIVQPDWKELEGVRAAFRDGTVHDYAASLD
ncbi:LCP family protein required for cell wall assembly [Leucobacter exalbidus]|uniref:LCP family protein required for cell wall assembly n=1 Tax=Leucobacter exalbidus TaxID=662960 RepID=A0A940T3K4_9MICO|nr:LCP family protein [Leucobacter exalbidus]MBP1326237.1 LCP family protein required for cell wall assembly [Leucobacter exalbidus]